jgi:hypothetical protein
VRYITQDLAWKIVILSVLEDPRSANVSGEQKADVFVFLSQRVFSMSVRMLLFSGNTQIKDDTHMVS